MAIYLDLQKAMELVDAAIEREGEDYIYPNFSIGCQYVDYAFIEREDEPVERVCRTGCIVGDALLTVLGVDIEAFSYEDENEENAYQFLGWLRQENYISGSSPEAENYLSYIQDNQDKGLPWGVARKRARERMDL